MRLNKYTLSGTLALLLLTAALVFSVRIYHQYFPRLVDFSELVKDTSYGSLDLTIYYVDTNVLLRMAMGEEQITRSFDYKIAVGSSELRKYDHLLDRLRDTEMVPIGPAPEQMDVRFHYVFETKDGRAFRVTSFGSNEAIVVNGVMVEANSIYYDVVMPYLPSNAWVGLREYIGLQ